MNDYELMFIVHPEADEDGVSAANDRVSQRIVDQGGEVVKTDVWGRRKLAYAINRQTEGTYVVMDLQVAATGLVEIERNLKLDEQILRYLIIRKGA